MDYIIGLLISFLAMGWYNCYYRLKNKNFIENEFVKVMVDGSELTIDIKNNETITGNSSNYVYGNNVIPFKKI